MLHSCFLERQSALVQGGACCADVIDEHDPHGRFFADVRECVFERDESFGSIPSGLVARWPGSLQELLYRPLTYFADVVSEELSLVESSPEFPCPVEGDGAEDGLR